MKKVLFPLLFVIFLFPGDLRKIPSVKLSDMEGKQYELKSLLSNQVTIITFWATWCKPCAEEMHEFQNMLEKYGDNGLKVIAISTDTERSVSKVKPFIKSKKFGFTVLLDTNNEAMRRFNIQAVPHTIIVNSKGEILYSHSGYSKGDELKVEAIVKSNTGKPIE